MRQEEREGHHHVPTVSRLGTGNKRTPQVLQVERSWVFWKSSGLSRRSAARSPRPRHTHPCAWQLLLSDCCSHFLGKLLHWYWKSPSGDLYPRKHAVSCFVDFSRVKWPASASQNCMEHMVIPPAGACGAGIPWSPYQRRTGSPRTSLSCQESTQSGI